MPNFWALKNLQKGQQVCLLNFNCRKSGWDLCALSKSSDCCCSHLNQATPQKILAKFYYPPKKTWNRKFFGRGVLVWKRVQTLPIGYTWFARELRECVNVFIISVSNSDRPQRRRPRRNGCFRRLSFKWLRNKEKYANSKRILTNLFCFCSNLSTVLVRLRAHGAYLLLVPQSWRALIRERALFPLLRNNRMLKTKL